MRKGMLLVVSGPSGAGKGRLKKMLIERLGGFYFSVSATARPIREGVEKHGVDYWFVTPECFSKMLAEGEFLETATVHGHLYGTPIAPVQKALEAGMDVLLEIDTQGALNVRDRMRDCVMVFITPPSFAVLERRLRRRMTDSEPDIKRRLQNALVEVTQIDRYDYVVINDDLEDAYQKLSAIVIAERQKTTRYRPEIELPQ